MEKNILKHDTNSNSNKRVEVNLLKTINGQLSFEEYDGQKYIDHVNLYGLEITWASILNYVMKNGQNAFLNVSNFGELYEAGLAEQDKKLKKKSGQYFTPPDVAKLMAEWLKSIDGENVCDVGCGTGNLTLAYLELIGKQQAEYLLESKKIYLYDFDKVALTIAQHSIALTYGSRFLHKINIIYGDFLDKKVTLPKNSKIITNPPYGKYDFVGMNWNNSEIQNKTKELYAAFMEKIILSNNTAVIITPYSFLGGTKFQSLRNLLSEKNGFIVAFDNVPGNIFNGRKHGIFNTNTTNSVRAAITVIENLPIKVGFRTSHLIRFKNEERSNLLKANLLKTLLSSNYQVTGSKNKMFARCHISLETCFTKWVDKSTQKLKDLLSSDEGRYKIYMPNTCRYFTTASKKQLQRGGYMTLNFDDKDKFYYIYSLINSSFVYWWWRIYDGGITYPVGLLHSVPVFYELLTEDNKNELTKIAKEMIEKEESYTITKLNAGKVQENIKFPKKYRDKINAILLKALSCSQLPESFNEVHKNSFFGSKKVKTV